MKIGDLRPPKGATHRKKRIGFGESSGHGKTSGRGTKGQNARSGKRTPPGFEGGQMPLIRRIPKRGFNHVRSLETAIVNVSTLAKFPAGTEVTPQFLAEKGMARSHDVRVKVLGDGEISIPLKVKAHAFSSSAREKIEKAGGTAELV
ncbi:MAG: 50S ribosomal protein L15 [Candidatus Omnitrophica bacterium]|nr:50S ribosomal protein L15 [Candidatus Omnitrophota bacterium]